MDMKHSHKIWVVPRRGEVLVDLPVFILLALMIVVLTSVIYSHTLPIDFDLFTEQTDVVRLILSTVPSGAKWPIYLAFLCCVITGVCLLIELHLQKDV